MTSVSSLDCFVQVDVINDPDTHVLKQHAPLALKLIVNYGQPSSSAMYRAAVAEYDIHRRNRLHRNINKYVILPIDWSLRWHWHAIVMIYSELNGVTLIKESRRR
jgi:hypothetical protein